MQISFHGTCSPTEEYFRLHRDGYIREREKGMGVGPVFRVPITFNPKTSTGEAERKKADPTFLSRAERRANRNLDDIINAPATGFPR